MCFTINGFIVCVEKLFHSELLSYGEKNYPSQMWVSSIYWAGCPNQQVDRGSVVL